MIDFFNNNGTPEEGASIHEAISTLCFETFQGHSPHAVTYVCGVPGAA